LLGNVFERREFYCAILMGKKTQMMREFVFDINRGGKYSTHWDINLFTNIYIT